MPKTETRSIARAALAVGDFLYIADDPDLPHFGLVVGRTGTEHAHVMHNTGRVTSQILGRTVDVAVGVPVEDFSPVDLAGYVVEQEAEARAAQNRAERLRLAIELVRQEQANQHSAAAEFARVIGQR